MYQAKLNHFIGDTTIFNSPSRDLNSHDSLSPGSKSNCLTKNNGMVVRKDSELVDARAKIVSVPEILSPNTNKDLEVYKVTYEVTNSIIYRYNLIGNRNSNRIGNKKVINVTVHNPRQLRALAILSSGIDSIKRIKKNHYNVKSQSKNGYYDVIKKYGFGWTCDCPNYEQYQSDCKHIYAVQYSIQLRLQAHHDINPDNKIQVSHVASCPNCQSFNVVKNGQRKCYKGNNQRYICKDCNHSFVMNRELSRLKANPDVICIAMDLYFKGNSLAKIKHHLKMFYKLEVSRPTIMRWVHKFSKILNEYSIKHTPQTGDIWNCDEMTINIRKDGVKKNYEWIWNLMDSDTRFLLASTITKKREIEDARGVLRQGKEQANGKPKVLITDGLQAYNDANKKELSKKTDKTIHFRTPSKRKYFLNQNIERLNGTIRERLKVMRGTHSPETAQHIIDGERFYYNFIKPHMSLNNMTPAQIANLPIPELDDNPWLTYLKSALEDAN